VLCFSLISIYVLDLLCRLQGLTEFAAASFLTALMFIHGMIADRWVYEPPLAASWCLDLCAKAPPVLSFNNSFQSLTVSGKENRSVCTLVAMQICQTLWIILCGCTHLETIARSSKLSLYIVLTAVLGRTVFMLLFFFCAKVITLHLLYLFNSFAFACFYLIRIPVHNPYHHKNKAKKRSYPRVLSLFSSSRNFSLKKKSINVSSRDWIDWQYSSFM